MHPARVNKPAPTHACTAVSPVMTHMVSMNAPIKKQAKPKENKKNLVIFKPPIDTLKLNY